MIQGNAIKINSHLETNINKTLRMENDVVVQFGKNKFKKAKNAV